MSSLRHWPVYCEINLYIWEFREAEWQHDLARLGQEFTTPTFINLLIGTAALAAAGAAASCSSPPLMWLAGASSSRLQHLTCSTCWLWNFCHHSSSLNFKGTFYDRISPAHTNMWYVTKKVMFLMNSCGAGALLPVALCFREQSVINQSFPCLQTVSELWLIWESVHPVGSHHPACSKRRSGEEGQG